MTEVSVICTIYQSFCQAGKTNKQYQYYVKKSWIHNKKTCKYRWTV